MPARGVEAEVLTGAALPARFLELDGFLTAHQALWKPRPFTHLQLPWEASYPELAQWLRRRSLEDAENDHHQPWLIEHAPAPFPQLAMRSHALSTVAELPGRRLEASAQRLNVDVPGRKWQQIEAFASRLQFSSEPTHWLDWCAGKGHLGRRLLHSDQRLTCLEYDPALVINGQQLSQRHHLAATHLQQDVLAPEAAQAIRADYTPVALHACGDLHVRLMQLASAAGCTQLAIAPCCYNRISADRYQPLSDTARDSALQLSIDDLGLPLTETVTAGARVRRQRDQSMAWRLGFDLLQRQIRGRNDYLPTPSLPTAWLEKTFARYCIDLAALKDLSIVGVPDWAALEAAGRQRLIEVRNLELVRGLFRRPLELWLALDRSLFLTEKGYDVRLGTFCEAPVTPRNLLLLAERCRGETACG